MIFVHSVLMFFVIFFSYTFGLSLPDLPAVAPVTSTVTQAVPPAVTGAGQTVGNVPNILPSVGASVPGPTTIVGNATQGVTGEVLPGALGAISTLPIPPTGILPGGGSPADLVGDTTQNVLPVVGGALPTSSLNPGELTTLPTQLTGGVVPSGVIPSGVLPSTGGVLPATQGLLPATQGILPSTPGLNVGQLLLPFPTVNCGFDIVPTDSCNITCALNPSCQSLGYNLTTLSCVCPAEICTDGQIYGAPGYLVDGPLDSEAIAKQPHVVAPCNNCVQAQVAPTGTQVGTCELLTPIASVQAPPADASSGTGS